MRSRRRRIARERAARKKMATAGAVLAAAIALAVAMAALAAPPDALDVEPLPTATEEVIAEPMPVIEIHSEQEAVIADAPAAATEATETANAVETDARGEEYHPADEGREWGENDAKILLKIAMAEAEDQGVKGKALVIRVVLNRVRNSDFPDSVEAVVFQKHQFSPIADGRYAAADPDGECYEALRMIEEGWDESRGALFFESCKGSSWHERNLTKLFEYKGHRFYK